MRNNLVTCSFPDTIKTFEGLNNYSDRPIIRFTLRILLLIELLFPSPVRSQNPAGYQDVVRRTECIFVCLSNFDCISVLTSSFKFPVKSTMLCEYSTLCFSYESCFASLHSSRSKQNEMTFVVAGLLIQD